MTRFNMNLLTAIFLGILQGLTEFFPVSSSGHLVIVQSLVPNFSQPGVLFDVVLHGGTLLSIVIYFRKNLAKLTRKYIYLLIIGTIPAGLAGILFQTVIEGFFSSTKLVGFALLLTALINFLTDKIKVQRKGVGVKKAMLIGVAQAIAIIPGISRSGSTIFAGTLAGIKKKQAAKFSFLLSIPAVLGANLLQLISYSPAGNLNVSFYVAGFAAALVSGYFAINLAINLLIKTKFKYFAFYCFVLGLVVLFRV